MAATAKANLLADNPHVMELFSILKENDKDTAGLNALLSYCMQIDKFVENAEKQIADMNAQIADMKEIQKHPIKNALQNAADSLQARVTGIKAMLNNIRERIVEGCKNAIQAVKDTGVTALDKMAGFFHVKQGFEAINKSCAEGMERCDKSVANIERFSSEYHATGLHLKNMGRMIIGKEPIETPKEIGKMAKAMCTPYKTEKKCLNSICNTANKAIAKLEDLGKNAADIRQERQERQAAKGRDNPSAEHLAEFELKAKQINAEKSLEKSGKVIEFKPKTADEAVMA
jgi:hypothetical protein